MPIATCRKNTCSNTRKNVLQHGNMVCYNILKWLSQYTDKHCWNILKTIVATCRNKCCNKQNKLLQHGADRVISMDGGWAGVTCWVEETTTPLDLCHTPRIDDEEAAAPWIHHKEASAPWIYHRRTTTGGQCSMDPPRRCVGFGMGRGRRLHGSPLLRVVEGWRGEPHPAEQAEWTRRNEWRREHRAREKRVEEEVRRRHNKSLRDKRPTLSDVRVLAFPLAQR
jgi:hypothetical protein